MTAAGWCVCDQVLIFGALCLFHTHTFCTHFSAKMMSSGCFFFFLLHMMSSGRVLEDYQIRSSELFCYSYQLESSIKKPGPFQSQQNANNNNNTYSRELLASAVSRDTGWIETDCVTLMVLGQQTLMCLQSCKQHNSGR